jgi:hypothetical protein
MVLGNVSSGVWVYCHMKNGSNPESSRKPAEFQWVELQIFLQIKYLSSLHIANWSIHQLCSFRCYFTSWFQNWDCINIRLVAVEKRPKIPENWCLSTTAQRLLMQSQSGHQEVKAHLKLYNECIDYFAMLWELKYLTGREDLELVLLQTCGLPGRFLVGTIFHMAVQLQCWPRTGPCADNPGLLLILAMYAILIFYGFHVVVALHTFFSHWIFNSLHLSKSHIVLL